VIDLIDYMTVFSRIAGITANCTSFTENYKGALKSMHYQFYKRLDVNKKINCKDFKSHVL
jgi:hypothetical protein